MGGVQELIPAAQYLRMSTEDQQYSIENQSAAIHSYAAVQGFRIVATYSDPGKSGLTLRRRVGLITLLRDVLSGRAPYKTILVYDVSRWGRFQDVDEAAHYEYLCKQARIPVRYCAEQFANDDSITSSLMKALKRTMAAEYSRELGVKVRAGMKRKVLLGHRMTGTTFGFRRLMVSPDGHRKQFLRAGEQKGIKSAHVILVPGPRKEIECVRKIFALADSGKTVPQIAAELNGNRVKDPRGRPWQVGSLYGILHNEVYVGWNVWGKTSQQIARCQRRIPRELWIARPGAFASIVEPEIFKRVQKRFARKAAGIADEALLRRMKRVLAKHGKLTQKILKKEVSFDHRTYRRRFGSIFRAYKLVGYEPSRRALTISERHRSIRALRFGLLQRLKELFPERVRVIQEPMHNQRRLVEVDGCHSLAVQVGCPHGCLVSGEPRWLLKVHPLERGLITLVCIPDRELDKLLDFYVVPQFGMGMRRFRVFGRDSEWLRFSHKLQHLSQLCDAVDEIAGEASEQAIATRRVGDTVLSEHTRTVTIGTEEICLAPMELAIFRLLVLNVGSVVSREHLCRAVRKKQIKHLNAKMSDLRKKLGKFRNRIVRVPSVGYLYHPEPSKAIVSALTLKEASNVPLQATCLCST